MNVKHHYADFDLRFIVSRRLFAFLLSLVLGLSIGHSTAAENPASSFPNRPVRIIVGFAPGGTADIIARIMAERLADDWKQSVVVDNRPGASGAIGAEIVARSAKDGYTLGIISGTFTMVPALGQKLPFDVTKDFSVINRVVEVPSILTAGNSPNLTNSKTFADFVATARSKPKQLSYVSSGPGSASHLKTELLASAVNAEFLHVPYKGSGAAITDLIAGRVDFMLSSVPEVIGFVRNKSLRPIVVASAKRLPSLPDVPSLNEPIKGFELGNWFAFVGPSGIPRPVLEKLNADFGKAATSPEAQGDVGGTVGYRDDAFPQGRGGALQIRIGGLGQGRQVAGSRQSKQVNKTTFVERGFAL